MGKLPTVKNYLKNVAYSVKYAIIDDTIEPAIPIVFEMKSENTDFLKELKEQSRHKSNYKFSIKTIKNTEFFKFADKIIKNSKDSLATGKFYDDKRTQAEINNMYNREMGDFSFDDLDKEFDNTSNIDDTDLSGLNNSDDFKNLDNDLNIGLKASSQVIGDTVLTSAKYTGDIIKTTAGISYAQGIKQIQILKTGFSALTTGIKNIIDFNTSSVVAHFENSQKYFENTTKLLTDQNAMMREMLEMQRNLYQSTSNTYTNNEAGTNFSNIVTSNGAVNIKGYINNIKKNIKDSRLYGPLEFLWNQKDMFSANPLEFVLSMAVNGLLGTDRFKKSLTNLNKTMSGLFGKLLDKVHDKANENSGLGIWSFLHEILKINDTEKSTIDTSKFEKGPMQFNGIANKAITEVIPGYLARIEAALTGNEERFFNMNTGKWERSSMINKKFHSLIQNTRRGGVNSIESRFRNIANIANYKKWGVDKNELLDNMDKVLNLFQDKKGNVDIDKAKIKTKNGTTKLDPDKLAAILGINDASPTVKQLIAIALQTLSNGDKANLYTSTRMIEGEQTGLMNALENAGIAGGNAHLIFNNSGEGANFTNSIGGNRSTKRGRKSNRNVIDRGISSKAHSFKNEISIDLNEEVLLKEDKSDELKGMISFFKNCADPREINYRNNKFTLVLKYLKHIKKYYAELGNLSSYDVITDAAYTIEYDADVIKYLSTISFKNLEEDGYYPTIVELYAAFYNSFSLKKPVFKDLTSLENTMNEAYENIEKVKEVDNYEKLEGKDLFEKINNAKGAGKLQVLYSYANHMSKMPFDILARVVESADKMMYDFFFGDSKEVVDSSGKKVKGFFDRLTFELHDTFEKSRSWIKDKILGDNFGTKYKDSVKDSFYTLFELLVSRSFKNIKKKHEISKLESSLSKDDIARLNLDVEAQTGNDSDEGDIPGNAGGLGYIPKTGLYMLSKGEAVIPSTMNPSNPWRGQTTIAQDAANEKRVGKQLGVNVTNGYAAGTGKKGKNPNVTLFSELKRLFPNALGNATVTGIVGGLLAGPTGLLLGASFGASYTILRKSSYISQTLFGDESIIGKIKKGGGKVLRNLFPGTFRKIDKAKKTMSDVKDFGIAGGALGLASSFIGGPIGIVGGLALGATFGFLKNSESAQHILFGYGDHSKIKKFFSDKYLKAIGLGGAAGLIFGGPLGLVGGMAVGGALKFASESDRFKDFLFGKKGEDGKREGGLLGKMSAKLLSTFDSISTSIHDYLKEALFDPLAAISRPLAQYAKIGIKSIFDTINNTVNGWMDPKYGILQKTIKAIKTTKLGKYLLGTTGKSALAGFIFGGPLGAVLGGIIGAGAQATGLDKKLKKGLSWLGKAPGKLITHFGNKMTKRLINKGKMTNMDAGSRLKFMEDNGFEYNDENVKQNDITLRDASAEKLAASKAFLQVLQYTHNGHKLTEKDLNGKIKKVLTAYFTSDEANTIIKGLKQYGSANEEEKLNIANKIKQIINESPTIKSDEEREIVSNSIQSIMANLVASDNDLKNMEGQRSKMLEAFSKETNFRLKDTSDKSIEELIGSIDAQQDFNHDTKGEEKKSLDIDQIKIEQTAGTNTRLDLTNKYLEGILGILSNLGIKNGDVFNTNNLEKLDENISEDEFNNLIKQRKLYDKSGNAYSGTYDDFQANKDAFTNNLKNDMADRKKFLSENISSYGASSDVLDEQTRLAKKRDITNMTEANVTISTGFELGDKNTAKKVKKELDSIRLYLNPNPDINESMWENFKRNNPELAEAILNDLARGSFNTGTDKFPYISGCVIAFGSKYTIDDWKNRLQRFDLVDEVSNKENFRAKRFVYSILRASDRDWDKVSNLVKQQINFKDIDELLQELNSGTKEQSIIKKRSYKLYKPTQGTLSYIADNLDNIKNAGYVPYLNDLENGKAENNNRTEFDFSKNKTNKTVSPNTAKTASNENKMPKLSIPAKVKGHAAGTVVSTDGSTTAGYGKDAVEAQKKEEQAEEDRHTIAESLRGIMQVLVNKKDKAIGKVNEKGKSFFEKLKDLAGGGIFNMILGGISGLIPVFGPAIAKIFGKLGASTTFSILKKGGIALMAYEGAKRLFNAVTGQEEDKDDMLAGLSNQRVFNNFSSVAIKGVKTASKILGMLKNLAVSIMNSIGEYISKFISHLSAITDLPIVGKYAKKAISSLTNAQKALPKGAEWITKKLTAKFAGKGIVKLGGRLIKAVLNFASCGVASGIIFAGIGFFTAGDTFKTDSPTIWQRIESAFLNGLASGIPYIGALLDGEDLLSIIRIIWPDFMKSDNENNRKEDLEEGSNASEQESKEPESTLKPPKKSPSESEDSSVFSGAADFVKDKIVGMGKSIDDFLTNDKYAKIRAFSPIATMASGVYKKGKKAVKGVASWFGYGNDSNKEVSGEAYGTNPSALRNNQKTRLNYSGFKKIGKPIKSYARGTLNPGLVEVYGYAGGTNNAEQIWNYLTSKGLGSNVVAGIMGNIQAESSFNPSIIEGGSNGDAPIPNTGFGLCQWTSPDRQQGLVEFANKSGKSVTDLTVQLEYMLIELNRDNPGLIKKMANMTPYDAALAFHKEFERSADTPAMAARRGEFAEAIFKTQGKGIKTGTSYSGGGASGSNGSSTPLGVFGKLTALMDTAMKPYNDILGLGGSSSGGSSSGSSSSFGSGTSKGSVSGFGPNDIKAGTTADYVFKSLQKGDPGTSITAPFGEQRSYEVHGGIDFGANEGTPVYSPVSGPVADVNVGGNGGGYGTYVQVKDSRGNFHMFPHLSSAEVSKGDTVEVGTLLGKVGSTGNSTGPHLHYEVDPPSNESALSKGAHEDPNEYPMDGQTLNTGGRAAGTITGIADGTITSTDYSDKLDTMIENQNKLIKLFTAVLQVLSSGATTANSSGMTEADISNQLDISNAVTNKMATSTPGKSIMDIMQNMLTIATN